MELLEQEDPPLPKVIGLTGGIGSGKTSVAKIIQQQGYPVYFSDDRAKTIVYEPKVKESILKLLGPLAYDTNGDYDRKYVGSIVFNDKEKLEQLNHIIHPAVRKDFQQWVSEQNSAIVFKETALLFELQLNLQCYKSVLVTAEDNIRLKRVMDRDNKTYREVENVMLNQMPEKDKCKKADFIIQNNGSLDDLEIETIRIIGEINQLL